MKLGKKVAIWGKATIIAAHTSSAARKGNIPLKMVSRGISGAIPLITNTFVPTGGEITPISHVSTIMTPSHMRVFNGYCGDNGQDSTP